MKWFIAWITTLAGKQLPCPCGNCENGKWDTCSPMCQYQCNKELEARSKNNVH